VTLKTILQEAAVEHSAVAFWYDF